MDDDLEQEWEDSKIVGNGGSSGLIYVPIKYAGYYAKLTLPDGNGGNDVITKTIGKGKICGVLYVHKKHLGETVKVVIPKQAKPPGVN